MVLGFQKNRYKTPEQFTHSLIWYFLYVVLDYVQFSTGISFFVMSHDSLVIYIWGGLKSWDDKDIF